MFGDSAGGRVGGGAVGWCGHEWRSDRARERRPAQGAGTRAWSSGGPGRHGLPPGLRGRPVPRSNTACRSWPLIMARSLTFLKGRKRSGSRSPAPSEASGCSGCRSVIAARNPARMPLPARPAPGRSSRCLVFRGVSRVAGRRYGQERRVRWTVRVRKAFQGLITPSSESSIELCDIAEAFAGNR